MLTSQSVTFILAMTAIIYVVKSSIPPSSLEYGKDYVEGDILLTREQQRLKEARANPNDINAPQNAVVRRQQSLWQGGVVPYVLDGLSSQAINATMEAIADYHSLTCIRFVQRTNQDDYLKIFPGRGCYSYIGRIGGSQDLSIGRGCESKGTVLHEMFHALGRWHEQSRPDRNIFVRILTENIRSGTENNFKVANTAQATTQAIPYDVDSIMHYSYRAFSNNGKPTIMPVDPNVSLSRLGQRRGLSHLDIQHVTTLYCGGGGSIASWSSWQSWSKCSRTCNGGTKSRTRTCNGGTSCDGSNIQTRQCNTSSCPVAPSWALWGSWSGCSRMCGGGRQSRIRSCVEGNTCEGIMAEFRNCNTHSCPLITTWASWSSWSTCSSTCQGGFQERRRTCNNGNTCQSTQFMKRNCNTNILCITQPNPNSGEWSAWSVCSVQCGGGSRFRIRLCGGSDCKTEGERCNTQDCDIGPELRGLKHHGCWLLNSTSHQINLLEKTTPELSDNPLMRERPISKCGVAAQTLNFNIFGITLGHCLSGTNRLSDYQSSESSLCRDGRGAFRRSSFFMDVYEITDEESFSNSVMQINNATQHTTNSISSASAEHSTVATNSAKNSMEGGFTAFGDMDVTSSGYKPTHNYSLLSSLLIVMFTGMAMSI